MVKDLPCFQGKGFWQEVGKDPQEGACSLGRWVLPLLGTSSLVTVPSWFRGLTPGSAMPVSLLKVVLGIQTFPSERWVVPT